MRRIQDERALDALLAEPAGGGWRTIRKSGIRLGNPDCIAGVAHHDSTIDEELLHAGGERILHRLDLSAREQADLVALLETLTEKEPLHESVKKTGNAVCR